MAAKSVLFLCIAISSLLLLATSGWGCGTGLLVIPTAETVGDGVYSFEYQVDSESGGVLLDTGLLNNQFGLGERFETGVDFIPHGDAPSRALGNYKYIIKPQGDGKMALAVGAVDISHHRKPSFFTVASIQQRFGRFHFGAMSVESAGCGIVGFDKECGKITFMCDYTTGRVNPASIGLTYQITSAFGIDTGVLIPGGGEKAGFTIHFVWNKSLRKDK